MVEAFRHVEMTTWLDTMYESEVQLQPKKLQLSVGKIIASAAIMCGVLVLALPITIIVDNFIKVAQDEQQAEQAKGEITRQEQAIQSMLHRNDDWLNDYQGTMHAIQ